MLTADFEDRTSCRGLLLYDFVLLVHSLLMLNIYKLFAQSLGLKIIAVCLAIPLLVSHIQGMPRCEAELYAAHFEQSPWNNFDFVQAIQI